MSGTGRRAEAGGGASHRGRTTPASIRSPVATLSCFVRFRGVSDVAKPSVSKIERKRKQNGLVMARDLLRFVEHSDTEGATVGVVAGTQIGRAQNKEISTEGGWSYRLVSLNRERIGLKLAINKLRPTHNGTIAGTTNGARVTRARTDKELHDRENCSTRNFQSTDLAQRVGKVRLSFSMERALPLCSGTCKRKRGKNSS